MFQALYTNISQILWACSKVVIFIIPIITEEEFCQGSKKFNDLPKITELLNETEKETESRSVRLQSPVPPATASGLARAAVLAPAFLVAEGEGDRILN